MYVPGGTSGISTSLVNGNIRIGYANPTYSRKIKVTTSAFFDCIFAKGYKLRSLSDLNDYIIANNHLPNIAVASEIQKNGLPIVNFK